jgi:SAM-dependent methyltransferase
MPKIDYSRIYRKWHSDTAEHIEVMVKDYTTILTPHLPPGREARVLDIGCGMGFAMLTLKRLGFSNVKGVERDFSQAESCRTKGLDVELVDDTLTYLGQNIGGFDLILALDLLEHIPVDDQLAFVNAVAVALAPGGLLICTVPNANSVLASRWRYICWTHHTSFTEHSLDFLLYHGGFQSIEVFGYDILKRPLVYWFPIGGTRHWWAFKFFRWWRRLQMMAELGPDQGRKVPLSLNLMGVARKR